MITDVVLGLIQYIEKMGVKSLSVIPTGMTKVMAKDIHTLQVDCLKSGFVLSVTSHIDDIVTETVEIERLSVSKAK